MRRAPRFVTRALVAVAVAGVGLSVTGAALPHSVAPTSEPAVRSGRSSAPVQLNAAPADFIWNAAARAGAQAAPADFIWNKNAIVVKPADFIWNKNAIVVKPADFIWNAGAMAASADYI